MVSLTPVPPTVIWTPAPHLGGVPVSLAASVPTFPGHGAAWPGRWRWQQVLLLSPQPRSSSHPEPPGSGTTERQLWAVPHWPGPHPYRGLALAITLAWARPCLPRTTGATWVGWAAQREGPVGPALATPGSSVCPMGCPAPAPCPVSATTHRAPPHPPHAPSCQSRCRVWCRAFSPSGWVGSPSPPICSLPGAFLCRFLNVILK